MRQVCSAQRQGKGRAGMECGREVWQRTEMGRLGLGVRVDGSGVCLILFPILGRITNMDRCGLVPVMLLA